MDYTRANLLTRNDEEFAALLAVIDTLSPDRREAELTGDGRDRSVRDVVAHLHAWHLLLERWYREGSAGGAPAIPAEGYSWHELGALNEDLQRGWQRTDLSELLPLLTASHESLQAMIAVHTDPELIAPDAYAWTAGSALGEFAWECGGNHYAWAREAVIAGLTLDDDA